MKEYSVVGKKISRLDGKEKVTGELKYMTDRKFPDLLSAKAFRAEYPHANIKSIDISDALRSDGIHCVLTARDIPGLNGFGIEVPDQPVLCDNKVRYIGDPIALVVGETEEQVEKALALVKIEYEALPVLDSTEKSMQSGAPLIHDSGNLFRQVKALVGDPDGAFTEADLIIENIYSTTFQEHAFLETEGGIGVPESDGSITIYCPAQHGHRDRMQLAKILNFPEEKILVVSSPVGGGFGGKDDINVQGLLALGALKTKRPVKIQLGREESFAAGIKRQPFRIKMRTAVAKDGKLKAQDVHIICDTGAYASLGGAITSFALENCCGAYYIPNVKLEGYTVYTNNPVAGEFRGFGNNQIHFALESQIDIIAKQLNLDPLSLRRINCIKPGQRHSLGHSIHSSVGALQTLETAEKSQLWKDREAFKNHPKLPWIKRGIGIALCQHGNGIGKGLPDNSSASIEITEDGIFIVTLSCEEIGQGIMTTIAIIAAEELGIELDRVRMVIGDTLCPDSGSTTASRSTFITGNTVKKAAQKLKRKLMETGSEILNINPDEMSIFNNKIISENGFELGLDEVAKKLCLKKMAKVTYKSNMPETDIDFAIGLHYMQGYLTQIVGVEVNMLTGKADVVITEAFPDAGKVINRLGYEGQVYGGTVMGLGYALMENFMANKGKPVTTNFQSYLIPTAADTPEIRITPVEVLAGSGPFGAKGFGETTSIPITPAIINAISDAIGIRVRDLPASPEKIYQLIQADPSSHLWST